MPDTGLFDVLGMDPDDPEIRAASEDAAAYERLIDALVNLRRTAGLSQAAVAERMGTTQSAVSDFERLGGDARYSTVQRYARAVGGCLRSAVAPGGWRSTSATFTVNPSRGGQTVTRPRLLLSDRQLT